MVVTSIRPVTNTRYKIYLNDNYFATLYKNDLKVYHIEEQALLDNEMIFDIEHNVLEKRARERAFYILQNSNQTTYMLSEKLKRNGYKAHIIEATITYLQDYNFLNDVQFAMQYINVHKYKKSIRQIKSALRQKGVRENDIQLAFETAECDEEGTLRKQFERYVFGKNMSNYQEQAKIYSHFIQKGYQGSIIWKLIRERYLT